MENIDPSFLSLLFEETIYLLPEEKSLVSVAKSAEKPMIEAVKAATLPTPAPISQAKPAVKNKNKLMILFNNESSIYLKPTEEALLQKILSSIHLAIDDIELVNYNNIKNIDYISLLGEKLLNQLISFGVNLTQLNLQLPLEKYKVRREEGISILLADSLEELNASLDKKKLLWKALQEMFMKK